MLLEDIVAFSLTCNAKALIIRNCVKMLERKHKQDKTDVGGSIERLEITLLFCQHAHKNSCPSLYTKIREMQTIGLPSNFSSGSQTPNKTDRATAENDVEGKLKWKGRKKIQRKISHSFAHRFPVSTLATKVLSKVAFSGSTFPSCLTLSLKNNNWRRVTNARRKVGLWMIRYQTTWHSAHVRSWGRTATPFYVLSPTFPVPAWNGSA